MNSELERVEHIKKLPIKCMFVSIENSCPHWHYDYEVVFVLKGTLSIKLSEKNYILKKGDIVLINTCEIHSLTASQQGNLCLILQFGSSLISDEFGKAHTFLFELNTVNNNLSEEVLIEIRQCLASLGYALKVKSDGYQFLIKSYLYKFINYLFCYTKYKTINSDKILVDEDILSSFDKVNNYIKLNFAKSFTISDLCKSVGISKSSLYRLLKKTSLGSYKDLINFYRIEHAKYLLKNTNCPISYIASVSGFDSDPSFYRSFKKNTGISPNTFRNSNSPEIKSVTIQGYAIFDNYEAEKILRNYL